MKHFEKQKHENDSSNEFGKTGRGQSNIRGGKERGREGKGLGWGKIREERRR